METSVLRCLPITLEGSILPNILTWCFDDNGVGECVIPETTQMLFQITFRSSNYSASPNIFEIETERNWKHLSCICFVFPLFRRGLSFEAARPHFGKRTYLLARGVLDGKMAVIRISAW